MRTERVACNIVAEHESSQPAGFTEMVTGVVNTTSFRSTGAPNVLEPTIDWLFLKLSTRLTLAVAAKVTLPLVLSMY